MQIDVRIRCPCPDAAGYVAHLVEAALELGSGVLHATWHALRPAAATEAASSTAAEVVAVLSDGAERMAESTRAASRPRFVILPARQTSSLVWRDYMLRGGQLWLVQLASERCDSWPVGPGICSKACFECIQAWYEST